MDAIKKEIERKKREAEEAKSVLEKRKADSQSSEAAVSGNSQPKKYVKRGLVEQQREAAIRAEQEARRKAEQEKFLKAATATPTVEEVAPRPEGSVPPMALHKVIKRLRKRGEPITLFGETDWDRYDRLRKLEEREPVDYKTGLANEFHMTLKKMEADEVTKEPQKEDGKKKEAAAPVVELAPSPTVPHVLTKEKVILQMLKKLIRAWDLDFQARPEHELRSQAGRLEKANFEELRRHIKPLVKQLKKKDLDPDILDGIYIIMTSLQQKEYVAAHDAYMKVAIGNAAWPMGVTMVGIHERSAREKIHSSQTAHVLNDETQRKYIQAIKRLISFCQRKWPTDPSKMVG